MVTPSPYLFRPRQLSPWSLIIQDGSYFLCGFYYKPELLICGVRLFFRVVVVVFKFKSNTASVDHIPLLWILSVPMSSCLTLLKHLRFSERSSCIKNSDEMLVENEICLKCLLNLSGSSDPGFAQQNLCMQQSMEDFKKKQRSPM